MSKLTGPRDVGVRAVLVVLLLVAAGVAVGGALAVAAKGSSGSFMLTGEVVATLKVPAYLQPGNQPGCVLSPGQGGTDVIVWDNQAIKEAGKTVTVGNMNLQLEVSQFGHTYSLKVSKSDPSTPGAAYLTTADPFQWASVSGTITTSAGGKSGTVDAVLSDGTHHPGTITLKGSWAGCQSIG
jgi:hypothetical protein